MNEFRQINSDNQELIGMIKGVDIDITTPISQPKKAPQLPPRPSTQTEERAPRFEGRGASKNQTSHDWMSQSKNVSVVEESDETKTGKRFHYSNINLKNEV